MLAKAAELPEAELDDLASGPARAPAPFLLASTASPIPGNLGALLRSAECAGVTGVVLPRHRAVHVTPTVTKAAAGAVEHLPMARRRRPAHGHPPAPGRAASGWSGSTIGGETAAVRPRRWPTEPVALVLGAEGKGLSRLVRERCDDVAAIPLAGRLASLNVAAAGALACFEVARRRLVKS